MDEMVDVGFESVVDDTQQVQAEELESLITEQPLKEEAAPTEPGWIKQRVNKAVEKAVQDAERRMAERYESMLQPIRESVLDRQAQEFVDAGEFKSIERAKEYVRLKGGVTVEAPKKEAEPKPRNDNGQFVDATTKARSDILAKQAEKIHTTKGIDVMQILNSDAEVKQKVLSGEWDFYDVAENHKGRKIPAPMRTPNGTTQNAMTVQSMSDEQFARLQASLSEGKRYKME